MNQLTTWPIEERPREKLLQKGAQSLTDAELLAIFLRTGIKGKNAIELAREIIGHFGSLKSLFSADLKSFCQFKGLGQAKFVSLQACIEMGKRHLAEDLTQPKGFTNPQQVKSYLQSQLVGRPNEVFVALFLDNQNRLLAYEELFFGTVNSAAIHPRVVVQKALKFNAAAIMVAHNHPSGVTEPSLADIDITSQLKQSLALMDIRLLDHFIIAGNTVTSLAEMGKI